MPLSSFDRLVSITAALATTAGLVFASAAPPLPLLTALSGQAVVA